MALPGSPSPINSTSLQIKNISVCLQTQHTPDHPRPHNQTNNDSSQPALPGNQLNDPLTQKQTPSPSITSLSNMVVSREINRLKNELHSIKAEIAELKRKPTSSFPVEIQCRFGQELKNIRQEVSSLQKRFTDLPTVTIIKFPETREPATQVNTPTTSVTVTMWNCRGVKNAVPYLHHLIENGSDIIAITEHWLWPYQLHMLQNIHPDYDGFGFSDNRLHENTDLIRGCGGVGIIWKKSLSV